MDTRKQTTATIYRRLDLTNANAQDSDITNIEKKIIGCITSATAEEIESFFTNKEYVNAANHMLINDSSIIGLFIAARHNDRQFSTLLNTMDKVGITINTVTPEGNNPLHEFITLLNDLNNDKDELASVNKSMPIIIKGLLPHIDINLTNNKGVTPLAKACCHRGMMNIELIKILLEQHADPNSAYGTNGNMMGTLVYLYANDTITPYSSNQSIARSQEVDQTILTTIKLLIDHGANFALQTRDYSIRFPTNTDNVMTIREFIQQEQLKEVREPKCKALGDLLTYYDSKQQEQTLKPVSGYKC